MEKIQITTPYIRLDALLKFAAAVGSGGEAKVRIQNGEISVNGQICLARGKKLVTGDIVHAGGRDYAIVGPP